MRHLCTGEPGYDETTLLQELREASGETEWLRGHAGVLQPSASGHCLGLPYPRLVLPPEVGAVRIDVQQTPEAPQDQDDAVDHLSTEAGVLPPFWVSLSHRHRLRRLHRTGGCSSARACKKEPIWVLEKNCADDYCRHCWRGHSPFSDEEAEASGGSTESSTDVGGGQRILHADLRWHWYSIVKLAMIWQSCSMASCVWQTHLLHAVWQNEGSRGLRGDTRRAMLERWLRGWLG